MAGYLGYVPGADAPPGQLAPPSEADIQVLALYNSSCGRVDISGVAHMIMDCFEVLGAPVCSNPTHHLISPRRPEELQYNPLYLPSRSCTRSWASTRSGRMRRMPGARAPAQSASRWTSMCGSLAAVPVLLPCTRKAGSWCQPEASADTQVLGLGDVGPAGCSSMVL